MTIWEEDTRIDRLGQHSVFTNFCDVGMQLDLFEKNKTSSFLSLCNEIGCDITLSGWPDIFGRNFRRMFSSGTNLNVLSLFSGAGGLDIGFHDIGFNIVERIEIEPVFCRTLRRNTGNGHYFETGRTVECDIRNYVPSFNEKIDFIIGGPPCQSFSAAGRRANGVSGIQDARGVLFKEYIRLLDLLKPFGFLFENVYGITGAQQGEAWRKIRNGFSDAGYKIFFRILDAADYGVPQHRERLIIVGVRNGDFQFPKPTHGPDSINRQSFYSAGSAISSLPPYEGKHIGGRFGKLLDDIPPGLNYSFYTEEMGHPKPIFAWRSKFSDFMYKADPEVPVRTIKAQGGQYTGPFHWTCRHFTIDEYKRLQTFPDNYVLEGNSSDMVRQIGNSVPPQLARILALAIRWSFFSPQLRDRLDWLKDGEELGFRKRKRELTRIYQEKARKAIKSVPAAKATVKMDDESFHVSISKNFKLSKTLEENALFHVETSFSDSLNIKIHGMDRLGANNCVPDFSIHVSIINRKCNVPFEDIYMECFASEQMAFTTAWKIFEMVLIENGIKADLVQLNGYYQYVPNITCKLSCLPTNYLHFLVPVVDGRVTRRILDKNILLDIWDIRPDQLQEKAMMMRRIGYEIRNSMTNPQIPEDCWLIPYPFPTLNPLSVQLRKSIC